MLPASLSTCELHRIHQHSNDQSTYSIHTSFIMQHPHESALPSAAGIAAAVTFVHSSRPFQIHSHSTSTQDGANQINTHTMSASSSSSTAAPSIADDSASSSSAAASSSEPLVKPSKGLLLRVKRKRTDA